MTQTRPTEINQYISYERDPQAIGEVNLDILNFRIRTSNNTKSIRTYLYAFKVKIWHYIKVTDGKPTIDKIFT